jgi:hypothetical protein
MTIPRSWLVSVALGALLAGLVLLAVWQGSPRGEQDAAGTPVYTPGVGQPFEVEPEATAETPLRPSGKEVVTPRPLSREELFRIPDGFNQESEQGRTQGVPDLPPDPRSGEAQGRKKLGPEWLDVSVESERIEGPNPSVGVQSTEATAGVKVTPGKEGNPPGDVSVSVEGTMRQEVSDREPDQSHRSPSVGVRVEVPWPSKTERKAADPEPKN